MCKISTGYNLTDAVLSEFTEFSERGAGVVAIRDGVVHSMVDVEGKNVRRFMKDELVGKCQFFLYHSRLPSVGRVTQGNTQPFFDGEAQVAFGHNGTIDPIELLPMAIAAGVDVQPDWSDSRMLWEVLIRVPEGTRKTVLSMYERSNFIWVDLKASKVELWGRWQRQFGAARTTYDGKDGLWIFDLPLDDAKLNTLPKRGDTPPRPVSSVMIKYVDGKPVRTDLPKGCTANPPSDNKTETDSHKGCPSNVTFFRKDQ